MKKRVLSLLGVSILFLGALSNVACSSDDDAKQEVTKETRTAIMAKHIWITSKIVDNKGNNIRLDVMPGAMYAGYAYYNTNGTFRIVDFKDGHKMYGLWSLKDNDTKRHLVAYKTDNTVAFERSVEIVELTNQKFTYKIADTNNPEIIYSVEHIPVTNHPEPKTPAEVLASVEWKTTKVFDITNGEDKAVEMDRTQAPASNLSGDAYYVNKHGKDYFPKLADNNYANGTFLITEYGDKTKVRSQGDWYVSLDGKARTLIARKPDGTVAFQRTVSIFELNSKKFTYDIEMNNVKMRVEHEPIK
ncbi:MAG: DUF4822 domain-containing protein [Flavobacteriaceae bacterium]|jgi:hypothetical protein|nr:DUF4822 domain-containing protein [Flavobacteriaceae bacterium]